MYVPDPIVRREDDLDPEREAELVDSVGLALLVVLETLAAGSAWRSSCTTCSPCPSRRSPARGRSPAAARQLASCWPGSGRGHTRRGFARQREAVDAFFAAARGGDFDALVAVLDLDVVLRSDGVARPSVSLVVRGGDRGQPCAHVHAAVAVRAAGHRQRRRRGRRGPGGRPVSIMAFTVRGGRIVEIDSIADPERLRRLDLPVLD